MTGPTGVPDTGADFASALRAAVQARGLSLEAIRQQLALRGHRLSVATLSYWQSGRSRPERLASLAALRAIEEILELPPGRFTSMLAPRSCVDPDGPERTTAPVRTSAKATGVDPLAAPIAAQPPGGASETEVLQELADRLGLSWDTGLERISIHDRMDLREDRSEGSHTVRQIVRATRPGVGRYPMWCRSDTAAPPPLLTALTNCRIGQAVHDRSRNLAVVEILLDQVLQQGESALVELRVEARGNHDPVTWWTQDVAESVQEIHLQVRFTATDLPLHTERVVRTSVREQIDHIDLTGRSLHFLTGEFGPGTCGLRWSW